MPKSRFMKTKVLVLFILMKNSPDNWRVCKMFCLLLLDNTPNIQRNISR